MAHYTIRCIIQYLNYKKVKYQYIFLRLLAKCNIHNFFFDWNCGICKEEYKELKQLDTISIEKDKETEKNYKEFNEERAKKLYEEVFLQYLKKGNISEEESITRSKNIIKKQCEMRGIKPWSWV